MRRVVTLGMIAAALVLAAVGPAAAKGPGYEGEGIPKDLKATLLPPPSNTTPGQGWDATITLTSAGRIWEGIGEVLFVHLVDATGTEYGYRFVRSGHGTFAGRIVVPTAGLFTATVLEPGITSLGVGTVTIAPAPVAPAPFPTIPVTAGAAAAILLAAAARIATRARRARARADTAPAMN